MKKMTGTIIRMAAVVVVVLGMAVVAAEVAASGLWLAAYGGVGLATALVAVWRSRGRPDVLGLLAVWAFWPTVWILAALDGQAPSSGGAK